MFVSGRRNLGLVSFQTKRTFSSQSVYVQGHTSGAKRREYFYYIDHEGMVSNAYFGLYYFQRFYLKETNSLFWQLFLDDARIKNFTSCFKEKHFLQFFFKRLKFNTTDRYRNEFPYLSVCGIERNYVRCDDLPIVFTEVLNGGKYLKLLNEIICDLIEFLLSFSDNSEKSLCTCRQ